MKRFFTKFIVIFLVLFTIISMTMLKPSKSEAETKRLNMSYIFFNNSNIYLDCVEQTDGSLNVISPNYFNINEDGSLQVTNTLDTSFINEMHKENIKVIPFISNHWDRELGRVALENREVLVEQIIQAIEEYDIDGINIDIENVTEIDRDNYTDFVKILREKLPKGKEISVAVAANPRALDVGWHGSYDYTKLADYADYLIIMAYDESYYGGPPGPVASYSFVSKSIEYALKKVSRDKIVLGIPFYGRYWNSNEGTGGNGISLINADFLIRKFNGTIHFDSNTKSPVATFTVPKSINTYTIGGNEITPGDYTLWYENETSIKSKLELVQKYNIKGTGSWALGQETPDTWNYYNLWLNGKYFEDVNEHWAKNDIFFVSNRGWMKGTSSTEFSPNMKLTRAQAAVILVRAMNLEGETVNYNSSFDDVSVNYWAYNEIQIAKEIGMFEGVGNNIFNPNSYITREQMATLISRNIDSRVNKIDVKKGYSDVEENRWSYKAIIEMSSLDIFEGYGNGLFLPTENMTRAQMATIMYRISDLLQY